MDSEEVIVSGRGRMVVPAGIMHLVIPRGDLAPSAESVCVTFSRAERGLPPLTISDRTRVYSWTSIAADGTRVFTS